MLKPLFTGLLLSLASVSLAHAAAISYRDAKDQAIAVDFAGHKLTAVHFWATWCIPCLDEIPQVEATLNAYGKRGLQVIPIAMENNAAKIQAFLTARNLTLPPYRDDGARSFRGLSIRALPTTVFFDTQGQEIRRDEGPLEWQSEEVRKWMEGKL